MAMPSLKLCMYVICFLYIPGNTKLGTLDPIYDKQCFMISEEVIIVKTVKQTKLDFLAEALKSDVP